MSFHVYVIYMYIVHVHGMRQMKIQELLWCSTCSHVVFSEMEVRQHRRNVASHTHHLIGDTNRDTILSLKGATSCFAYFLLVMLGSAVPKIELGTNMFLRIMCMYCECADMMVIQTCNYISMVRQKRAMQIIIRTYQPHTSSWCYLGYSPW